MHINLISIFPEYFAPLALSLIGKAQERDLISVTVHDLRTFTEDRHRTVDDTPYGGGPGMVMRPQPWGAALDAVRPPHENRPLLIFPTPSGQLFSQKLAHDWAAEPSLTLGCGRYEGIDERVALAAREQWRVVPVSLGDYVLNGGEVAALAIIEAVVRLIPGVIGNAESLVEESHEGGLLEYPVYTKPALWRGLAVPEVLLSGNHGAIKDWRSEQRHARTAQMRPELLHPEPDVAD
jgi:tRNA (guanine37-N1)-methyltransferase